MKSSLRVMLATLFLSFVLSNAEALICPDGWTSTWLNQCYLMSPNKMNWFQAQEVRTNCRSIRQIIHLDPWSHM